MVGFNLDIIQYGALYVMIPSVSTTEIGKPNFYLYSLPTATYSIANQLGIFTAAQLNVNYSQVASSSAAFSSLLNGEYDILTATFDNALNYRLNLNESVTVLGQLDQGPDLVIASVSSITNVSQLQGKPLIVDSPTSGFSYLLRYVLATLGLAEGDYSFQTVGGTSTRYADLLSGSLPNGSEVYATILTYPFTLEGQALPLGEAPNVIARVADYIAPITSSAFMARESSWTNSTNTALLTRFMAAMLAANVILHDPSQANCSIKAISQQLDITQELAAQEYASATDSISGEVSPGGNFTVDQLGALNDVNIRKKFGGFGQLSDDFDYVAALDPGRGKLIDYFILNAAIKLFDEHGSVWAANCSGWSQQGI